MCLVARCFPQKDNFTLKALEFRLCFPRRRENILSGKLPDRILKYLLREVPSVLLSIIYVCLMMLQPEHSFLDSKETTASSRCVGLFWKKAGLGSFSGRQGFV